MTDPMADLAAAQGILAALAQIDDCAAGEIERAVEALKRLVRTDERVETQRAAALRRR